MTKYKVIKQRPGSAEIGSIGTMVLGYFLLTGCTAGVYVGTKSTHDEFLEEVNEGKVADSREALEEIKGYCVNSFSKVGKVLVGRPNCCDKSTRETKEQAQAQLAKSQLSQLRADTREKCGDWKADWEDEDQAKHTIRYANNNIDRTSTFSFNTFLAFPTKEVRDEFMEKHRDLIMQALPLYS